MPLLHNPDFFHIVPMAAPFSPRELEVIRLLVEERLDAQEIGDTLGVARNTVLALEHRIHTKMRQYLGFRDTERVGRMDVAAFAIVHGIVNLEVLKDRYSPVALAS